MAKLHQWCWLALIATAACGEMADEISVAELGLKACPAGETLAGIDVSKWQGSIDWFTVASAGIEFAFIRVSDGLNTPDQYFQTNWKEARNVGIVRGVYQFFRPAQDPKKQADYLLNQMGPLLEGDLPPVIDVEVMDGQSPATIVQNMKIWLDTVENALGVKPIIYTSPGFWAKLDTSAFGAYPLWVAHWGTNCPTMPSGWTDWVVWQTSESGTVPGIAGAVDTNLFNGSIADLKVFGFGKPSCEPGCQMTSAAELQAIKNLNKGWIGGACTKDSDCGYGGGICLGASGGNGTGFCSQACTKFCPDAPGMSITFCVEGSEVGIANPPGLCVMKCDHVTSHTGCRPGYQCVNLPRFNDPGTTALTCIPNTDPNAIDPFAWSHAYVADDCVETKCALQFGQVCTEDGGAPHCAFAVCLDPVTFAVNEGTSCSNLGSDVGICVTCDAQGTLLSSEPCSAAAPCNSSTGTCGGVPTEICDGKDNDCDGQIDEGVMNACGACGDVPTEVCDGKDNDCDGQVDEGLSCGTTEPDTSDPSGDASSLPPDPTSDAGPTPNQPEGQGNRGGQGLEVPRATAPQGGLDSDGCQSGGRSPYALFMLFGLVALAIRRRTCPSAR